MLQFTVRTQLIVRAAVRMRIPAERTVDSNPNEPYSEDPTKEGCARGSPSAIRGGIRNTIKRLHNQHRAEQPQHDSNDTENHLQLGVIASLIP